MRFKVCLVLCGLAAAAAVLIGYRVDSSESPEDSARNKPDKKLNVPPVLNGDPGKSARKKGPVDVGDAWKKYQSKSMSLNEWGGVWEAGAKEDPFEFARALGDIKVHRDNHRFKSFALALDESKVIPVLEFAAKNLPPASADLLCRLMLLREDFTGLAALKALKFPQTFSPELIGFNIRLKNSLPAFMSTVAGSQHNEWASSVIVYALQKNLQSESLEVTERRQLISSALTMPAGAEAFDSLLRTYATMDPTGAATMAVGGSESMRISAAVITAEWAAKDPQAAGTWLNEVDVANKDFLIAGYVAAVKNIDPNGANAWLTRIKNEQAAQLARSMGVGPGPEDR